jgi:hypothetical protein
MAFRQTDVRRVQAVFDQAIDAPYEAIASLQAPDQMAVKIMDPDEPEFCVWQCRFDYVAPRPYARAEQRRQPSDAEIAGLAAHAAAVCIRYPEQKAREAAQNAERQAIAERILEAKAEGKNRRAAEEVRAMIEASKREVPDDVLMNGVAEAIAAGIANQG